MKAKTLQRLIWRANGPDRITDILIQLPDNEPPVDFDVEVFEEHTANPLLIVMPKPRIEGHVWDVSTNVITSSPSVMPPGEYAVTIDPALLVKVATGQVPASRLAVRDGALVDFKA